MIDTPESESSFPDVIDDDLAGVCESGSVRDIERSFISEIYVGSWARALRRNFPFLISPFSILHYRV